MFPKQHTISVSFHPSPREWPSDVAAAAPAPGTNIRSFRLLLHVLRGYDVVRPHHCCTTRRAVVPRLTPTMSHGKNQRPPLLCSDGISSCIARVGNPCDVGGGERDFLLLIGSLAEAGRTFFVHASQLNSMLRTATRP